ncbi:hypothetical protein BJ508DRAFT_309909 [Ascobolus immersus RN42]|uniref:Uncharacterized protein n=1 Tax=Ascobolus immersus RN42 TaxID=1160509 RepID=A0A3N4I0Q0_ASCIM|nr:hypothetical protein BJ508DRAFT_309909 [Ascobolus immersus RN42]
MLLTPFFLAAGLLSPFHANSAPLIIESEPVQYFDVFYKPNANINDAIDDIAHHLTNRYQLVRIFDGSEPYCELNGIKRNGMRVQRTGARWPKDPDYYALAMSPLVDLACVIDVDKISLLHCVSHAEALKLSAGPEEDSHDVYEIWGADDASVETLIPTVEVKKWDGQFIQLAFDIMNAGGTYGDLWEKMNDLGYPVKLSEWAGKFDDPLWVHSGLEWLDEGDKFIIKGERVEEQPVQEWEQEFTKLAYDILRRGEGEDELMELYRMVQDMYQAEEGAEKVDADGYEYTYPREWEVEKKDVNSIVYHLLTLFALTSGWETKWGN